MISLIFILEFIIFPFIIFISTSKKKTKIQFYFRAWKYVLGSAIRGSKSNPKEIPMNQTRLMNN